MDENKLKQKIKIHIEQCLRLLKYHLTEVKGLRKEIKNAQIMLRGKNDGKR